MKNRKARVGSINSTKSAVQSTSADNGPFIINKDTEFQAIEAYKVARTNIMFSLMDSNNDSCKIVIFTSAIPGEGKTTTAINMAITFAQTDAKVLLIDADLRRPRVHRYLKTMNIVGLSNVLGGFSDLPEAIQTSEQYGFDYITSGHIPPNPAELLLSDKMKTLLETLSKSYEYIFLDMPPVAAVTDTAAVARMATGVIIVVREKYTPHPVLKSALSALKMANAKILGFILTAAGLDEYFYKGSKYGKYGYKRHYGYGYRSGGSGY